MQGKEAQALEMLETLTKQMAVAVTCCSRDLRYLWANQAYADWIQRPLNEIVGHPILDVLGKDAFEALRPHFNRVLMGETVRYEQETNFRGIGPRWTSATYTPTLDVNGAANGWVAVVLDATERKRAEEARFRHAAIIESSEDAIICKNLDALITSWNGGAERLFGYTEPEVLSEGIPDELSDEISICLFRILQEAVQNAAKHSGARHFRVSLRNGSNQIELTVRDPGIGFDPEMAFRKSGLGLTSMRERMKLVNGELSIVSELQRGTTVCARVSHNPQMKSVKTG